MSLTANFVISLHKISLQSAKCVYNNLGIYFHLFLIGVSALLSGKSCAINSNRTNVTLFLSKSGLCKYFYLKKSWPTILFVTVVVCLFIFCSFDFVVIVVVV